MNRLGSIGLAIAMCVAGALGAPRAFGADEEENPPVLTANGEAEVSVRPDQAVVRLGAEAQAKDAAEAQQQVSRIVQEALKRIKGLGIGAESISTSGLRLQPVYGSRIASSREPQQPEIVGFRANNLLRVTVADLEKVGKVIDAGVGAGCNEIQEVSFGLKNDRLAKINALEQAVSEARRKAEAMARAMGVKLGRVQSLREGGVHTVEPQREFGRMMMAAAPGPSTPIEPGQIQVEAQVTVEYRIEAAK